MFISFWFQASPSSAAPSTWFSLDNARNRLDPTHYTTFIAFRHRHSDASQLAGPSTSASTAVTSSRRTPVLSNSEHPLTDPPSSLQLSTTPKYALEPTSAPDKKMPKKKPRRSEKSNESDGPWQLNQRTVAHKIIYTTSLPNTWEIPKETTRSNEKPPFRVFVYLDLTVDSSTSDAPWTQKPLSPRW